MKPFKFSRRHWLLGSGAAAAGISALALPRWLRQAKGQSVSPKRIVFIFSEHGTVYAGWKMRPDPSVHSDDKNFSFSLKNYNGSMSHILEPLASLKNKMTVVDGLSLMVAYNDLNSAQLHYHGGAVALTGMTPFMELPSGKERQNSLGPGPSLDQLIAQHLGDLGTLEAGVKSGNGTTPANFIGSKQSLSYEFDPSAVLNRIVAQSGDGEAPNPVDVARRQLSSFVSEQYRSRGSKLGQSERARLNDHADLLSDLQARQEALANIDCSDVSLPESITSLPEKTAAQLYRKDFEAQAEQLAAALSCGMVDVATLSLGLLPYDMVEGATKECHFGYAHGANGKDMVGKNAVMANYHRVHADQVAHFASLLDSIPDSDGNTMLDNTLVVWTSQVTNGDHFMNNWPMVILGGGNTGLNTGTYVHYRPSYKVFDYGGSFERSVIDHGKLMVGPPHNKLLVSLAKRMGMNINQVGETTMKDGHGNNVDLTGELPELKA